MVQCESADYVRPVRRLAARSPRKDGTWAYAVIISSVLPHQAKQIAGAALAGLSGRRAEALAYAYAYDGRGGQIEIELKEDKQGLGIGKRGKKRFDAAQMLMLLNQLAHNVLVWARRWLAHHAPELGRYGLLRWVRDILRVSGFVVIGPGNNIVRIVLNQASSLARQIAPALVGLLLPEQSNRSRLRQ